MVEELLPGWVYILAGIAAFIFMLAMNGVDAVGLISSMSSKQKGPAPERLSVNKTEPTIIKVNTRTYELDGIDVTHRDEAGHEYAILYDKAGDEILRCWDYQLVAESQFDALTNRTNTYIYSPMSKTSKLEQEKTGLLQHEMALTQEVADIRKGRFESVKRDMEGLYAIKRVISPAPAGLGGGLPSWYSGRYGGRGGGTVPQVIGGETEGDFEMAGLSEGME